jgi:magnesium transporter
MPQKDFEYRYIKKVDTYLKEELARKYGIQELDIDDVVTDTQLSKLEKRPDYLYVALQFPEYIKTNRHFVPKEIHCFVSNKFILIIDKHDFKHVQQFHNLKDSLLDYEPDSFNVFYELLDFCVKKEYRVLGKFKKEIDQLESDIFDFYDGSRDLLKEILIVKRNLINFTSIIFPLKEVINEIQTKHIAAFDKKEGIEELDDSLDKIKKILNNLANFKEQMTLLTETNESLIARNTNQSIRALTVINFIFIIPTVITSFFGMNVYFGWNEGQYNLFPLISIIIFIAIFTLIIFFIIKKKKFI